MRTTATRILLATFTLVLAACSPSANLLGDEASEAVATVNGEEITRSDYEANIAQVEDNATLQGQNVNDPTIQRQIEEQVLNQMIATVLLHQQAISEGMSITDEEVETRYQELVQQLGGEEALKTQLETADLTEEEFRERLGKDLLIQKYVDQQLAAGDTTVTDEEMRELYDQLAAQQELPPYEEVEEPLRQQLVQQKEQAVLSAHIAELRAAATVEIPQSESADAVTPPSGTIEDDVPPSEDVNNEVPAAE